MTEGPSGLENLLLGEGSEKVSLSPEQLAERSAAAAAAMAKLRKAEKKARGNDKSLVAVVKELDFETIKIISTFISASVPSITLLALLSLNNAKAKKVCDEKFNSFVQEWAFVDKDNKENPEKPHTEIGAWWTHLIMADHVSDDETLAKSTLAQKDFDKAVVHMLKAKYPKSVPPQATAFYDKYVGYLFPSA